MKTKKVIVSILIFITGLVILTSCNNEHNNVSKLVKIEETFKESKKLTKQDKIIINFLSSITSENYKKLKKITGIEDSPFVTNDDIKNFIMTTTLDEIIGNEIIIEDINIDKCESYSNFKVELTCKDENIYYTGILIDNENETVIDMGEVYLDEWTINTGGQCEIKVDGIDVSEYIKGEYLRIPNVYIKERLVEYNGKGGSVTTKMMPEYGTSDKFSFDVIADKDYADKAITWYIETLNKIIKSAANDEDVSSILHYFDSKCYSIDQINEIFEEAKEEHIKTNAVIYAHEKYVNDKGKTFENVILNSNGDIKLTKRLYYIWNSKITGLEDMTMIDQVVLIPYEDEFKIKSMYKDSISLTYLNYFTHD